MALHKRNTIRLILLTLILITILSSFQIINVKSSTTINYSFDERVIYESSNPSFSNITNVVNQTHYTNVYNGTHSFTGETGQTSTSISFVDSETSYDGGSEVIATLDNHDEVLQFQDDITPSENPTAKHDISQAVAGIIEFWLRTDDNTEYPVISLLEGATTVERIRIYAGNIAYTSSAPAWVEIAPFNINQWYHIAIDWGADNKWDLYINGSLMVDDVAVENNQVAGVDGLSISHVSDSTISIFIDGFGDTAEGYIQYDNVIPYNYPNNTLNIDKWDFGYNENGTATESTQQDIPFWDKVSHDGLLLISILGDGRSVYMRPYSTTYNTIEHDFSIVDGIILVHFNFLLQHWYATGAETHYIDFDIYSYDDTLIVRLRISGVATLDLQYYDGSGYNTLESNFHSVADTYDFNISIYDGLVFVESSLNNYFFESIDPTKAGIGEIEIDAYASGSDSAGTILNLNEVGLYVNGISLTDDYGVYSIGNFLWDLTQGTSFRTNITGESSIAISWETYPYSASIIESTNFSGYQHIYNSYLDDDDDASNVYITFVTKDGLSIHYLKIYQIYMTDAIDNYFPVIESSGIDVNESYFYVDGYSRLRYTLISDDNNSEYIEAIFNVPDLQTENYSASFMSNIDGSAYGFFRVSYVDDTSSFIPFPVWLSTTNVILPQTREIATITVLITDNDNFYNDICYGFITNVQLRYMPDMSVQIITLNLMMVIVPIMVLLVPTFGISARYGKNTILPVFILMSIICFATSLIPIWVFFIIMLSAGAFLFMKRKGSDD